MEKESLEVIGETATRKDVIKKIGIAIAAASLGSLSTIAGAAQEGRYGKVLRPRNDSKLSRQTRLKGIKTSRIGQQLEGKSYHIWVVEDGDQASIVAIPSTDAEGIRSVTSQLGGAPANAIMVGGVVQINPGQCRDVSSSCFNGSGNGNKVKAQAMHFNFNDTHVGVQDVLVVKDGI